ncbi:restriction endonuclease subunit S [Vibrio cyclitrophicus]
MVPNDWNDGRVGDLVSGLESGVSVNGEDRLLAKGEKGVLKVSAVSYGVFDENAVKAVTSGEELKRAKTHPKKGQIIISRSNTEELVGASAYIESDFDSLFLPDKLWQTIPKPNSDMKWLSYVLASEHSRYTLSNLATGTSGSMKNITKGELLGLKVSIPPLPEQRKIAEILSIWDNAIATTEKLIETSRQQKKALMQQLLTGKKRLIDPETGKAFEGQWAEGRVSDLLRVRKEKLVPTDEIPLFSLTIEKGVTPKSERYNREFLVKNSDEKKYKVVYPKDIVYNPANLRWGAINYSRESHAVVVSPIYEVLYVSDITQNSLEFIAQKLMSSSQINRFATMVEGTLMERKSVKIVPFLATKITVPPTLSEQQQIASALTAADKAIEALQAKLAHFKREKKALMQQLLTGKRRVKVAETESA